MFPAPFHDCASLDNFFPEERKGCLDAEKLQKLGLTKQRMKDNDALFFYLLFPICNPKISGLEGDERMGFFQDVNRFTNLCALRDLRLGGNYGHPCTQTVPKDIVHFFGVNLRAGALGLNKNLHLRWDRTDPCHDIDIIQCMLYER